MPALPPCALASQPACPRQCRSVPSAAGGTRSRKRLRLAPAAAAPVPFGSAPPPPPAAPLQPPLLSPDVLAAAQQRLQGAAAGLQLPDTASGLQLPTTLSPPELDTQAVASAAGQVRMSS